MSLIKSIHDKDLTIKVTRQQEFELMQDIYQGTLEAAAEMHNARHPVKVAYRLSFITASQESPFHVLTTEMSIDNVWHKLSRHVEKVNSNDRMTPRLVVYRRAFAELACGQLIVALSHLVDPVTLSGGALPSGDETAVVNINPNETHGAAA